jgi:hypothetical protein
MQSFTGEGKIKKKNKQDSLLGIVAFLAAPVNVFDTAAELLTVAEGPGPTPAVKGEILLQAPRVLELVLRST